MNARMALAAMAVTVAELTGACGTMTTQEIARRSREHHRLGDRERARQLLSGC